jgi:hypothetical protein
MVNENEWQKHLGQKNRRLPAAKNTFPTKRYFFAPDLFASPSSTLEKDYAHGWPVNSTRRGPTDKLPCEPEIRIQSFYPWDRSAIRGDLLGTRITRRMNSVRNDSARHFCGMR